MITSEGLYALLPAVYRIRDAEQGYPLQALFEIFAREGKIVEDDIRRLYDNWFIETCDEWVVPYIGDLLRVRNLHPVTEQTDSLRAFVANTMAYRRRKGTAAMLEQLARDTTGWPARAVEYFELLATTQHVNHRRLGNVRTPDLRLRNPLELLDGAFDTIPHTAEVRRIADGRGRHNIMNVGIFLWRLESYFIEASAARKDPLPGPGLYRFHPAGLDAPLFNTPVTETEITHLAEERNVPGVLRRYPLFEELTNRRIALVAGSAPAEQYFTDEPVLQVGFRETPLSPVVWLKPEEVMICDLSDWSHPAEKTFTLPDATTFKTRVSVDPALGRLAVLSGLEPEAVELKYAWGFSGDLGGGPYDRSDSIAPFMKRKIDWQIGVDKYATPLPGEVVNSIQAAVSAWNAQPPGTAGIIVLMDSQSYAEDLTGAANRIRIPDKSALLIVAGSWPETDTGSGLKRHPGNVTPADCRPHLIGNVEVAGTAPDGSETAGELAINGLLLEGGISIIAGNLGGFALAHSTVVPSKGGISAPAAANHALLAVALSRSICGPVSVAGEILSLEIEDCIVEGVAGTAIDAQQARAGILDSTVFGAAAVRELEAGNDIFTGKLVVTKRQEGCVRYSYVPPGSQTPRRFRCQPDLAAQDVEDPAKREEIIQRMLPTFASDEFGSPRYAQLTRATPAEIRAGADDESEMGAWHFLRQPQREGNLRAALDEYLRFGLEAGLFFAT